MAFGVTFRNELKGAILGEFEALYAGLAAWTSREHKSDGTHGDITADSLTLQGAPVGELVDLPFSAARYLSDGAWVVAAADQRYLRASRLGQLAWVEFFIDHSDTTGTAATALSISLPEFAPLSGRETSGGMFGAEHVGGSFSWLDSQAGTAGSGYVHVVTINSGGRQAARLRLVKHDAATFANSNNLRVQGFALFPLNRDNVSLPF